MTMLRIIVSLSVLLIFGVSAHAQNEEAWYPLKGDDGAIVTNHRIPVELESQIEDLPGIVVVGNPHGDVTLVEFYDLNCPYCRKAATDISELIRSDKELRLVLVPLPVLGVPSIQAGRVELAVAKIATPKQFYDYHRKLYAGRGVVDGNRALAVAKELRLAAEPLIAAANDDSIGEIMKAHLRLANSLGLAATPSFVIKGVAILGHPGRRALENVVRSIRKCDMVVCQ